MPSAWTLARAAVDPIARQYNLYSAYRIGWDEYVGSVDEMDTETARWWLRDRGYRPQYLSAAKARPDAERPWEPHELHSLSYRRVPDEHPPGAEKSALGTVWSPNQCQYHVHVFETGGGMAFFSHYELRPDLFRPLPLNIKRLHTHYRPGPGEYLEGVTDLSV